MDAKLLMQLGLTFSQAKTYIILVKHGALTPPEVAGKTKETRSNTYKILDKLVELDLAKKFEQKKKFVYRVENPIVLEQLAEQKRKQAHAYERQVKDTMPSLLNYFYTFSEQPGIRFLQGREGIREIYLDQIRTKQPIYLITTPAGIELLGYEFMHELRNMARKHGIERYALTADTHGAPVNWQATDKKMLLDRTWIPRGTYEAPVEWCAYGDKVSIISFGEEAIGMILYSQQIAESFRQLFSIMKNGLRADKDYHKLPKHADVTAAIS